MKPFTLYKVIFLLFFLGFNNLYAVQSATVDPAKTEAVATIKVTATKKNQKKAKKKARLIEKFKEKIARFFPKDSKQKNAVGEQDLETRQHGLSIASLILGIVGILTVFLGVGFFLCILAVIFGAVSKKKIRNSGGFYTGKGMATAGLVLGIIPLIAFVLLLFLALALGGF